MAEDRLVEPGLEEEPMKEVVLDASRWIHRLTIKQIAKDGERFADGFLEANLFQGCKVEVWGEVREGYFLSSYEVVNEGRAVLLELDLYDTTGMEIPDGT